VVLYKVVKPPTLTAKRMRALRFLLGGSVVAPASTGSLKIDRREIFRAGTDALICFSYDCQGVTVKQSLIWPSTTRPYRGAPPFLFVCDSTLPAPRYIRTSWARTGTREGLNHSVLRRLISSS